MAEISDFYLGYPKKVTTNLNFGQNGNAYEITCY